ncbi:unnamed protein product [Moneuplotes crassus]|uniref:Uncharacterized protein n=1 Tax=Euplotes crassus TaxID=5936 RepID=A0AAD1Y8C7_EUPCR|nr:unnamed protein product [Moneuplotes crassus]
MDEIGTFSTSNLADVMEIKEFHSFRMVHRIIKKRIMTKVNRHILEGELSYHAPRIAIKDIVWCLDELLFQNNMGLKGVENKDDVPLDEEDEPIPPSFDTYCINKIGVKRTIKIQKLEDTQPTLEVASQTKTVESALSLLRRGFKKKANINNRR